MTRTNLFISVVTVAYKDDPYLKGLLSSIEKLDYPKDLLEIIVVSILAPEKKIPVNGISLQQILINHRVGYSEAINIGISKSKADYLVLPNPDTELEKTAIKKMAFYLSLHDDVGIVGPKVFSLENRGSISPYDLPCKNFRVDLGRVEQISAQELQDINKPQEMYWVCGNGIMTRKKIWEAVYKYDESYFLYWEDSDFNMKVRKRGYKTVLIPDAKLFHKGFASVGNNPDQDYYVVRNGRFFINKYGNVVGKFILHLTNAFVLMAKYFRLVFQVNDKERTFAFIEAILDFYRRKRGMRNGKTL